MHWCPGQRCNLAVRVLNSAVMTVKCRCGHAFCPHCAEDNHAPVSCARLAEWNEKCKNESETAHWIIAKSVLAQAWKEAAGGRLGSVMARAARAHQRHVALCFFVAFSSTKKCPKCAVRIEKSQGCNHVRRRCDAHLRALSTIVSAGANL